MTYLGGGGGEVNDHLPHDRTTMSMTGPPPSKNKTTTPPISRPTPPPGPDHSLSDHVTYPMMHFVSPPPPVTE